MREPVQHVLDIPSGNELLRSGEWPTEFKNVKDLDGCFEFRFKFNVDAQILERVTYGRLVTREPMNEREQPAPQWEFGQCAGCLMRVKPRRESNFHRCTVPPLQKMICS